MLTDPQFYLTAAPAVLLFGIAKGGFAGPVAVMTVPILELVMSPTQAAADSFALHPAFRRFQP